MVAKPLGALLVLLSAAASAAAQTFSATTTTSITASYWISTAWVAAPTQTGAAACIDAATGPVCADVDAAADRVDVPGFMIALCTYAHACPSCLWSRTRCAPDGLSVDIVAWDIDDPSLEVVTTVTYADALAAGFMGSAATGVTGEARAWWPTAWRIAAENTGWVQPGLGGDIGTGYDYLTSTLMAATGLGIGGIDIDQLRQILPFAQTSPMGVETVPHPDARLPYGSTYLAVINYTAATDTVLLDGCDTGVAAYHTLADIWDDLTSIYYLDGYETPLVLVVD
ncbi:hypothetical protein Q5752_004408 [Cryptotrichosporon argae]